MTDIKEILALASQSPRADAPMAKAALERIVELEKDADRYHRLRGWMSRNVPEGWCKVEELGAIACYIGWEYFDEHLDGLGTCNVGLMEVPAAQSKEQG
jgi:hypothetical protein